MFLSRLILNPRNRKVRKDITDCYQMHRTILKAFPHNDDDKVKAREKFKLLYRLEDSPRGYYIQLLIQSIIEPNWEKLPQNYLLTNINAVNVKEIGKIYNNLKEHQKLRFKLLSNPTKKINTSSKEERLSGKKKNGTRIPLLKEEDQIKWIQKKGIQHGFKIINLKAIPKLPNIYTNNENLHTGTIKIRPSDENINKSSGSKSSIIQTSQIEQTNKRNLSFNGVLFTGVMEITDKQTFLRTLKCGIGSGKAFGFGLLSIAPY